MRDGTRVQQSAPAVALFRRGSEGAVRTDGRAPREGDITYMLSVRAYLPAEARRGDEGGGGGGNRHGRGGRGEAWDFCFLISHTSHTIDPTAASGQTPRRGVRRLGRQHRVRLARLPRGLAYPSLHCASDREAHAWPCRGPIRTTALGSPPWRSGAAAGHAPRHTPSREPASAGPARAGHCAKIPVQCSNLVCGEFSAACDRAGQIRMSPGELPGRRAYAGCRLARLLLV